MACVFIRVGFHYFIHWYLLVRFQLTIHSFFSLMAFVFVWEFSSLTWNNKFNASIGKSLILIVIEWQLKDSPCVALTVLLKCPQELQVVRNKCCMSLNHTRFVCWWWSSDNLKRYLTLNSRFLRYRYIT